MTAESDLLASLTNPHPPYPWEPSSPEAEAYFSQVEGQLDDPLIDGAIATGWQRFSAQLHSQWDEGLTPSSQIAERLTLQFQSRMPSSLLQTLATTATSMTRSGQSLLDQLVACASAILPSWDEGDLAVLARPLAYSLRDGQGEILDLNLRAIPQVAWETLSDIEQARLSLTIASIALKAVKADER